MTKKTVISHLMSFTAVSSPRSWSSSTRSLKAFNAPSGHQIMLPQFPQLTNNNRKHTNKIRNPLIQEIVFITIEYLIHKHVN